ncbi:MAG: hypothetical protein WBN96_02150 [Gammaproteobacteria bacterium]
MSGIQLSADMVSELKAVLIKHDPAAADDIMYMQYLTAVTGFVLAHQQNPAADKQALLNDLCTFMGQVVQQVERDSAPQPPAADAFGIWKPGQG